MYTKTSLHIERITFDECFWEANVAKVQHLFEVGIMPELLGRWFSRLPEQPTDTQPASNPNPSHPCSDRDKELSTATTDKYCYCQGDEYGEMVGCDNDDCPYKWFHLECLHLKSLPKSKEWYCPDCRKVEKYKKKRKRS